MKKTSVFLLPLLIVLLPLAVLILYLVFAPAPRTQPVIAQNGESEYKIAVDVGDRACRAAGEYLSWLIEQRTGAALGLWAAVPEFPEDEHFIVLSFENAEGQADAGPYSLVLDDRDNLHILFHVRGLELACVQTICGRWLTESCGVQADGTLRLTQEMIDGQLSALNPQLTGSLRVLTQNLFSGNYGEGNMVLDRAARFIRLVHTYRPDIIGTQETTQEWHNYLFVSLSDTYSSVGASRDGFDQKTGERNSILYRTDRFLLLDSGTFWLSDTPDEVSMFPGANYLRICTWALLKDNETGCLFYAVNTHLHFESSEEYGSYSFLQLRVLFQYMEQIYERDGIFPVILTGDFNSDPSSVTYALALEHMHDAGTDALVNKSTVSYTYHKFGSAERRLDYCFYQGPHVVPLSSEIAVEGYDGYISDHYGVFTDFFLY